MAEENAGRCVEAGKGFVISARRGIQVLLLLIACWAIGDGLYIRAKAVLAQILLETAWQRSVQGETRARPWSWADTWPVARLQAPRLGIDQIVLAGVSGRVLAFGPGHMSGTALLDEGGNTVVSGHRDTHFKWLKALRQDDELVLTLPQGIDRRYRVSDLSVHHESDTAPLAWEGGTRLTLLTCYPFDAIDPGGPLRYAVTAESVGL